MTVPGKWRKSLARFLETGEATAKFMKALGESPELRAACEADLRGDEFMKKFCFIAFSPFKTRRELLSVCRAVWHTAVTLGDTDSFDLVENVIATCALDDTTPSKQQVDFVLDSTVRGLVEVLGRLE